MIDECYNRFCYAKNKSTGFVKIKRGMLLCILKVKIWGSFFGTKPLERRLDIFFLLLFFFHVHGYFFKVFMKLSENISISYLFQSD